MKGRFVPSGFFFWRLLVGTLLAAVPALVAVAYLEYQRVVDAQDEALHVGLDTARAAVRNVDRAVTRLDDVMTFLLAREEVRKLEAETCGPLLAGLHGIDLLLNNVVIADVNGERICTARPNRALPSNLSSRPWFQEGIAANGRHLSPPYRTADKRMVVTMTDVIRDADGKPKGLVAVGLDMAKLSESFLMTEGLPDGSVVALVDDKNRLVGRSRDLEAYFAKEVSTQPRETGQGLPSGLAVFHSVDGVDRAYAAEALKGQPWRLYVGVPLDAVAHYIKQTALWAGAALLLTLLASLLVAWRMARWLARPVQELSRTALELTSGQRDVQANVRLPGEFGRLASAINTMVSTVSASESYAVRQSQLYRALAEVQRAAANATNEQQLYESVCDAGMVSGAVHGLWIGAVREQDIVPVAGSGSAQRIFEGLTLRLQDMQSRWGFAPVSLIQPTSSEPEAGGRRAWHVRATAAGLSRLGALPLVVAGRVRAMLAVHVQDDVPWTEQHGQLLQQMAATAASALEVLEAETAKQEARRLERLATERFQRIFETLPVSAALYSARDGRFKQVNDVFCSTYGLPRERLIGHTLQEYGLGLAPEDYARYRSRAQQEGRIQSVVVPVRAKDGRELSVLSSATMVELDGEPYVLSVHIDINDRVRAERALKERELQLRNLVDTALDGILTLDRRGLIIVCNEAAARMHGVSAIDVVGLPLERFMPSEGVERYRADFREILEGEAGTSKRVSAEGLRTDGSRFPVDVSLSRFGNGEDATVTVVVRDMTEMEKARQALVDQAQAEASNRAKTEFLSRMSHELRTPLNAVMGFCGLLQESTAGRLAEDETRHLELIALAGAQLRALIDDILDLSRIEAGQLSVQMQTVDLCELVEDVARMNDAFAQHHDVTIERHAPAQGKLFARTDPIRLQQVLVNVLTNAVKYNRTGGFVHLSARADDKTVELRIEDTGIGMTQRQLQHVFEPFNRLGRESSPVSGSGIGLSLTHQLMSLLDGRIRIESTEGQGTVVFLDLPRAQAPADVAPVHEEGKAAVALADAEPSGTVLYVEDIDLNAFLVRRLLAPFSKVKLEIATDAASGLQFMREHKPNLVLLDMQLPDKPGQEVLAEVRGDAELKNIPVVALSANALPADIARAREAGADDYWTKPIHFDSFRQGVVEWLTGQRKRTP